VTCPRVFPIECNGPNHFPRVLCTNRLWAGFLGFKERYCVEKELAPEELLDA
jgi:hypothetical protein